MYIKRKITFYLLSKDKGNDKKKQRALTVRICYHGNRVEIPTSLTVSIEDWNKNKHEVKPGRQAGVLSAHQANAMITRLLNDINEAFGEFENRQIIPDTKTLKQTILNRRGGNTDRSGHASIVEAYQRFRKENGMKRAWSTHTYQVYTTLWNDLTAFRPNIGFKDLNETGLIAFTAWLRDEKPVAKLKRTDDKDGEIGLKDTTLKKRLSTLKIFLRWAEGKSYPVSPDFRTFRPRFKPVANPIVYLTEDEIRKLAETDLSRNKTREGVRDLLLFLCYTGIRFSDAEQLRRSDLHDTYFSVTTIKTGTMVKIDYNNVSRAILEKYKDTAFPGDRALPVITNQKTNEYIKDICRMAGIDTPTMMVFYKGEERREVRGPKWRFIASHTGRRSFICNALAKGIPVHIVMKWTGHTSYATMKPYIDAVDSVRAREMKRFDETDVLADWL